jgi:hypothetical protein
MSSSDNMPLSQLAASLMDADDMPATHVHEHAHVHDESCSHHSLWAFVFYFLVIALVLYFVFFALRPSFVLKQCNDSHSRSDEHSDEIDNGRLLASAVVGALILIFIFWLFSWLMSSMY